MLKSIVHPFVDPICIYNINLNFNEEKQYVENIAYKPKHNSNLSLHSKNTNLKTNANLQKIFNFFKKSINHYEEEILGIDKYSLYITQAWTNKSEKGFYHKEHYHPNSIISGVFYFQDLKEVPAINFFKPPKFFDLPKIKNKTIYNSGQLNVSAKEGDLILFPSQLWHGVSPNNSNQIRYSLSFNTFANVLGLPENLNFLQYGNN